MMGAEFNRGRSYPMRRDFIKILVLLIAAVLLSGPVRAQSADADSTAAARELVATIKLGDQFKAMLPMIFKSIKPAIVQNRPDVDRDYDALVPIAVAKMNARVSELEDALVAIYASNFSAGELRDLITFYKSPTGQKLLQKTPFVTQQTMAAGQKFGQSAGAEAQKEMIEELRSKGHSL
jgi:hypothetical protein